MMRSIPMENAYCSTKTTQRQQRQRWKVYSLLGILVVLSSGFLSNQVFGQTTSDDLIHAASIKWQIPEGLSGQPKSYTCFYTEDPIHIDGELSEKTWQEMPFSDSFGDILGASSIKGVRKDQTENILPTQVKMCWNNQYLYIGAKLTEPHIRGHLKQRDTIVFHDNDFEIFIDPANTTRNYFEFEINALNTLLDLFMPKPYNSGGNAVITWDAKGIEHQVALQGTLNQHTDQDSSWTVEIAIPFAALQLWGKAGIPAEGDFWRINFSRVQWDYSNADGLFSKKRDANGRVLPEHNWTWSPQGVSNMHLPERWGYLIFAKDRQYAVKLPIIERQKQLLWQLYYLQKAFFQKSKTYALTLGSLGLTRTTIRRNWNGQVVYSEIGLEATPGQFILTLKDKENQQVYSIDQLGNLKVSHQN